MVKAFSAAGESIEQWQPKFDRKKGLVEQCEAEKSTIKNFRNAQGHHFGSVYGVEAFDHERAQVQHGLGFDISSSRQNGR